MKVAVIASTWRGARLKGVTETSNSFSLSDTQREFRTHLRQFCEDKIAPRAAEVDRTAEYPWDNFKECVSMELPALGNVDRGI